MMNENNIVSSLMKKAQGNKSNELLCCGAYEIRTRDLLRDRQAF